MSTDTTADLVLTGARVHLGAGRTSNAVAIRAGRIIAIGTSAEISDYVGRRTRVVHAPGGLVLPGFQDSHIHAPFAGRNRLRLWLNDLTGRQAYLEAIAEYARTLPGFRHHLRHHRPRPNRRRTRATNDRRR